MPNIEEKGRPSDWLKREADSHYSREQVTIASGEGELKTGAVLGQVTASGKYVRVNPASVVGEEGAEAAAAILLEPVDATSADVSAVVIARDAIVSNQGLVYPADVDTPAERTAVHDQLGALSPPIIVREGA